MSITDAAFPETVLPQLRSIGQRDIVVGIPTFQSEATVGGVVRAVEAGIRKAFPDRTAAIVISDGCSSDGTVEAALGAGIGDDAERYLVDPESPEPAKVALPYLGLPGKGSAFRAIFEVAGRLGAVGCAVVDSDLRSIQPFWLDNLLRPVLDHGFDHVAPVYARHRFDGTITNSIAYPVTAALYGTRLRQPIGGDFGFSGALAAHWAARNVWNTDVARFGIDIWMTTVAVVEGYRVCQTNLGAKIHDPKDPGADLGPMFRQVVGSLFALAGKYHSVWAGVKAISDPQTFGLPAVHSAEPVAVSRQRLLWKFVEGQTLHGGLWRDVMADETFDGVMRAIHDASEHPKGLVLSAPVWFRIVYDFLVAYNARHQDPSHLLDALVPLYFARTATFVAEAETETDDEAEARIKALVDDAVNLKPYLVERWREGAVPQRMLADQPVPREGRVEDWVH
jgi:glucosylglycerate synthase